MFGVIIKCPQTWLTCPGGSWEAEKWHSRSVLSYMCRWNLSVVVWFCTGLVILLFYSRDCWSPCEPMPAQKPAVLPTPEAAYAVTLTICHWTWWRKWRTWMRAPFICSVNLLICHVNDSLCLSHRALGRGWDDRSLGDCTKEVRFEKQCRGQRGCLGIGNALGESKVLWKLKEIGGKGFLRFLSSHY